MPLRFLILLLVLFATSGATAQEVKGRVAVGGIGRLVSDRWTAVRGIFTNRSDKAASVTAVVTPPNSDGLQYARQIEVPAQSSRVVQWPMKMPVSSAGLKEVEYLVFGGGDVDGTIQRSRTQDLIRTFSNNLNHTEHGHTGVLMSGKEPSRDKQKLQKLLSLMLKGNGRPNVLLDVTSQGIAGSPEALDGLDQLSVSSSDLVNDPATCEAIRIWTQRGGRLHIAVDQARVDVARMLLGDALPITHVDTTSETSIKLELDARYPVQRFPMREAVQDFEEPVGLVRTIVEGGQPIWSIDGWPAVVRASYGRGQVLLTMVGASALVTKDEQAIPSSTSFWEVLFSADPPPLISRDTVMASATERVGYQIPSRGFAMAVAVGFPVVLLVLGFWLQGRDKGERLIWAVPAVAVLAALPAVSRGLGSRGVAPETVIRTQVIRAVDGETRIASDGYATVYKPDSGPLKVQMQNGSVLVPEPDAANRNYRRLLWTAPGEGEWVALEPGVGMTTSTTRDTLSLSTPMRGRATLGANGLTGTLGSGVFELPKDAILANTLPERQAVRFTGDGNWDSSAADVLAGNEFFRDSILTEAQAQQAQLFASVFEQRTFVSELTMLYWAAGIGSSITVGDEDTRRDSRTLIIQPVMLEPPVVGEDVLIPPVLLPYRLVAAADGSFGVGYSNNRREWTPRERRGQSTLAFEVPEVCLPFDASEAIFTLRIKAGSREVAIYGGAYDDMQLIETLDSPVRSYDIPLPIQTIARGEKIFVRFEVSDPKVTRAEGVSDLDQDDTWAVERVYLTLRGKRTEQSSNDE